MILHPRNITDEQGKKVSVVLSVEEYESLLEEIKDLALIAERGNEKTATHEDIEARLKADDLI